MAKELVQAHTQSGDLGKVKIAGLAPVTLISQYIKTGNGQAVWWTVRNLGTLAFTTGETHGRCKAKPTVGPAIPSTCCARPSR